jgi:MFS family permease
MAISRGLNGIGLALVLPAISSLVADYTDDHTRGAAFGWLQMTCNLGSILGGSLGVLLAPITFLGVAGWRVAFHAVAVISVALGVLMWLFAADPAMSPSAAAKSSKTAAAGSEAKELLQHARRVLGVTTFQIIVAQGIAGSIPWSALNFSAMWLELAGFTNWETSVITGLYLFATALGALFGGLIGDPVARRFPNTGRIALAQISSASALPLGAILLLALPNDPSTGVAHAVAFFVMGFAISWNASSTNKYECLSIFAIANPLITCIVLYYWWLINHCFSFLGNCNRNCNLQPHLRGDCAGEGEDDGVRAGQVFRSSVRVVRVSHRRRSRGARVRL